MNWREHYVCVFESKNHAVMLYTLFEKRGYDYFNIISTPCSLNRGCSYSLKFFNKAYIDLINREAESLNIDYKIFSAYKDNGRTRYRQVKL